MFGRGLILEMALFVPMWAVMVSNVGEEGPGELEGGVSDEEEVAGECEEGEEGDEGGAVLRAVFPWRAEWVEERHWERHLWRAN